MNSYRRIDDTHSRLSILAQNLWVPGNLWASGKDSLPKNSSLSDELQVEHKHLLDKEDLSKLDHITEVDIS